MDRQPREGSSHSVEIVALWRRIEDLEAKSLELETLRQELQEEHSFRNAVINRAAEGISVCHAIPDDPFVQFTVWNSRMEEIVGHTRERINRLGWYQSVYPDPEVQERARRRMDEMRDGVDLLRERWVITRADGEKRSVRISTSGLTSHDGQKHVLAMMSDVTDEERHREGLEGRVADLVGLLPICSACRKIRVCDGEWQPLEAYIRDHTETKFTHGICEDCREELYPKAEE